MIPVRHALDPSHIINTATMLTTYPALLLWASAVTASSSFQKPLIKDGTGKAPAHLPSINSTSSFWLREPSPKLLGHRSTHHLPREADVIVIGSGISGAFAARELVTSGKDVVMLEAREACWGATGRVSDTPSIHR